MHASIGSKDLSDAAMIALMRLNGFVPNLSFLSSTTFWGYLFCILWLHRYIRLFVHCVSHWMYRSIPIPEKPTLTADDVTVIIPTIHNVYEELRPTLESVIACKPAHFILVTTSDKHAGIEKVARSLGYANIEVMSTPIANKRLQVCEALPHVRTKITVMADDDIAWPTTIIPWLLAPFEGDSRMGGVGTCQRVRRLTSGTLSERVFNWLGAAYIQRRNFEISATHNLDGGTSCMSGRTGAYRTEILSSHDFLDTFKTEKWGKYTLNADDDNLVTRWLVNHQWKTWIQYEPECEVETTLENDTKFLYQCTRWARSNWRSNWTSLVTERYVWTQQPWCTYALHITTFSSLALLFDPLLVLALWWGTANWDPASRQRVLVAQLVFMFGFTKVVKLLALFRRNPRDLVFLPASIMFGYLHGFVRLYALSTLRMTSWGSRPDGDAHNSARLTPRPSRSLSMSMPSGSEDLIRFRRGLAEKDGLLRIQCVRGAHELKSQHQLQLPQQQQQTPQPQSQHHHHHHHHRHHHDSPRQLNVTTDGLDLMGGGMPHLTSVRTAPVSCKTDVPWRDSSLAGRTLVHVSAGGN